MKKKRYPTYKRKYKRKKQPRRKILTAIILCVILAVCNGWMPPRSLKEVKDQSRIFGQVFLTYIEENAQILWEDVSESASDAVTGLPETISDEDRRADRICFSGSDSGIQRQSICGDQWKYTLFF